MPINAVPEVWKGNYSPPEARELPSIRNQLCDLMTDPRYLAYHEDLAAQGRILIPYTDDPAINAKIQLDQERQRLADARLYWVSPEMTELAVTAAQSLPEGLCIDDMCRPAPCGFVVFGQPIGSYVGDQFNDRTVDIAAVSWGPVDGDHSDLPVTWVSFYSPRDDGYIRQNFHRVTGMVPHGFTVEDVIGVTPKWQWDNELLFPATVTMGDLDTFHEQSKTSYDESTLPWLKVLCSTWLLMDQPGVAETDEERATRQMRRRDQRQGMRTSDVQLIYLRRERKPHTPRGKAAGSGGREYSVRWPVGGHWRRVRCGEGGKDRRWAYIALHIRGPIGKPLKLKKAATPVRVLK